MSESRDSQDRSLAGQTHESYFDLLPREVSLHILKRLCEGSDREALVCLLVCKDWNSRVKTLLRSAAFGTDYEYTYSRYANQPYNLVLPFVRSLQFPNLKSLHLASADANIGSWRLVFETLGRNCPDLESLRLGKASPLISTDDLQVLNQSLRDLRELSLAMKCLEVSAMASLALLTSVRDLTLWHDDASYTLYDGDTLTHYDEDESILRNLGHIESLTLEAPMCDFIDEMIPAMMTSLRRLRLCITDVQNVLDIVYIVKSLVSLEALSLHGNNSWGHIDATLKLEGLSCLRELALGSQPCFIVDGLERCSRLTKLHLCDIMKSHLDAIAKMQLLEDLRGHVGADVGKEDLDILACLPVLRKLYLAKDVEGTEWRPGRSAWLSARQLASIGTLEQLQELALSLDKEVRDVSCLGRLSRLSKLKLDMVSSADESGGDTGKSEADINGEDTRRRLSSFPLPPNLHIHFPKHLRELPTFARPEAITMLELHLFEGQMMSFEFFWPLSALRNLEELSITSGSGCRPCTNPGYLSLFSDHTRLSRLRIGCCSDLMCIVSATPALVSASLWCLPGLKIFSFSAVQHLKLDCCNALPAIGPLGPALQELTVKNCFSLQGIPALSDTVRRIYVRDCKALMNIHPLGERAQLESLAVDSCPSLSHLPPINHLHFLRTITLINCQALTAVPSIDSLRTLHRLTVADCRCILSLPTLPPSLVDLHVSGCPPLHHLPTVAAPERSRLRIVHLERCIMLQGAAHLLRIESLERVTVRDCKRVKFLDGTLQPPFHFKYSAVSSDEYEVYRNEVMSTFTSLFCKEKEDFGHQTPMRSGLFSSSFPSVEAKTTMPSL